jgi:hypothetical protein
VMIFFGAWSALPVPGFLDADCNPKKPVVVGGLTTVLTLAAAVDVAVFAALAFFIIPSFAAADSLELSVTTPEATRLAGWPGLVSAGRDRLTPATPSGSCLIVFGESAIFAGFVSAVLAALPLLSEEAMFSLIFTVKLLISSLPRLTERVKSLLRPDFSVIMLFRLLQSERNYT